MYAYSTPSGELIETLKLIPHPEGGHYAVTYVDEGKVASPYASVEGHPRAVQSTIYYLLSVGHNAPDNGKEIPERLRGHCSSGAKLHKNRSSTMHALNAGRAVYTLIQANAPKGKAPEIRQVVMGEDASKGETRQLMVDGNWWKVSEIPKEDLEAVEKGQVDPERVGCLITEVVTPAFDWEDHTWLDQKKLEDLFGDDKASIERFAPYVQD